MLFSEMGGRPSDPEKVAGRGSTPNPRANGHNFSTLTQFQDLAGQAVGQTSGGAFNRLGAQT